MQFSEVIELDDVPRTRDVLTHGSFESLMISPFIIKNLTKHKFNAPSPIQEKAIPAGLSGLDLLVQAKSGTGKTLVFAVMAVENLNLQLRLPQRLIVAPTREIATQIKDTIERICHSLTKICVLVGGNSVSEDIRKLKEVKPHIIVGTTGRICQLTLEKHLSLKNIDLFVLDEADKLMEQSFEKDINFLFSCLPSNRQVAVFSATYPRGLDTTLSKFMKDATLVRLNSDDVQLIGIKQYALTYRDESVNACLERLFKQVAYNQALVFCNKMESCEPVSKALIDCGFEAGYISSQMVQVERDKMIMRLKQNKIKILVSTDLTARGIDAENVNLVVNIETALSPETYFHRIGRAARFGGRGAAITLLKDRYTYQSFKSMVSKNDIHVRVLEQDNIPTDLCYNEKFFESCSNVVESAPTVRTSLLPASEYVPDDSKGPCKYSHEEVFNIRRENPKLSLNTLKVLEKEGLFIPDYHSDLDDLRKVVEQMKVVKSEEKRDDVIKAPEAPKKKYKFVPSREKAKKKFYMRGEMLSIRDAVNAEGWRAYAKTKFNLDEDPFVTRRSEPTVSEKTDKVSLSKVKTEEKKSSKKVVYNDNVIRYTRKDLIGLQMKVPKNIWMPYIKSKWDTTEEPWQLDPYLRCSFEQQLRRQRVREKEQRNKIVEDLKKKAVVEGPPAYSRSIVRESVTSNSFADFCAAAREKADQLKDADVKKGSVVPLRDSPVVWTHRHMFYTKFLRNIEQQFDYNVRIGAKALCEAGSNTEEVEALERTSDEDVSHVGPSEPIPFQENVSMVRNDSPLPAEVKQVDSLKKEETKLENNVKMMIPDETLVDSTRLRSLNDCDDSEYDFDDYHVPDVDYVSIYTNYMNLLNGVYKR